MPLTPFIGLSTLVHLVLVLIFRSALFILKKARETVRLIIFGRWFSWLIVTCVSFFVMTTAFFILNTAIREEHSSINFVLNRGHHPFSPLRETIARTRSIYGKISISINDYYDRNKIEMVNENLYQLSNLFKLNKKNYEELL